jgi:hypothetical protein
MTQEDLDAIDRLSDLVNCDKDSVKQAYIVCDKNENMAAN